MNPSLGVIGTGQVADFHYNAFDALGVTVRAISDLSQEAAQPTLDRFGAAFEPFWQQLVERPDIDAVVVLSPSSLHYTMCKGALVAGKHVICEKTLTLCGAESLELAERSREKGLCLYTCYMKRFFPAVQMARELVRDRLGTILSVHCRTFQGVGQDLFTGEVFEAARPAGDGPSPIARKSGGGVLICGGSHILDLLVYLVGKPTRVYGRQWFRDESDLDLMSHALMDFAGGAVAHLECNWHAYTHIGYERVGWDEGFEINGTGGRLCLETPFWFAPEHNAPRLRFYDTATGTWQEFITDPVCPFQLEEAYFMKQIAAAEQGEMDTYAGYRVDNLLETIIRSEQQNRPLDMKWDDG